MCVSDFQSLKYFLSKMKYNIILLLTGISFLVFAYSGLYEHDRIQCTELNGAGCVCHSLNSDPDVSVWVEGPDTLYIGQTGIYRMYLTGGPAEAGGYNVAGRFGLMIALDSASVWDFRAPNELTQAYPLPFPSPEDTIFWEFGYTASDSSEVDTIYSCGLSLVWDSIPDSLDRWNFGPKLPLTIIEGSVPVELITFNAALNGDIVLLTWQTATETNNAGFEVQRMVFTQTSGKENWETIGFVPGAGTVTEPRSYTFSDQLSLNSESRLTLQYRLKQIDHNGSFRFYNSDMIEYSGIGDFHLYPNYPNPFNPETVIEFELPAETEVSLKVFDLNGEEVMTLIQGRFKPGKHKVVFNAAELASGIYFYTLNTGIYTKSYKMVLMR